LPGASPNGFANAIKRNISAANHKVVLKTQYPITPRAQPCIARNVMTPLFILVMRRAIEFDNESMFDAYKIDDIATDRNLSAELEPVEA